ncbi:MAG: alpha/beta hydrolase [Spirochaetales bacterium]|jgi:pimeloyl-ACP methyl ester carboxylesterase|nr:alpha/beta hydrolase [Spirochaetales bacterium]
MISKEEHKTKVRKNFIAEKGKHMEMIGQSHKTIVNGISIAWSEMGSGPPLVLIHGFQDTHRVWAKVAPLLADDFRVLMIDLPGSGLSDRPDAPYTLTWYACMVVEWMDAIDLKHAHVCGHSFGGGIAQWMLLENASRIDRLALLSPGGLGREVGMWLKYVTFPVIGHRLTPLVVRHIVPMLMRFVPGIFGKREPGEIKRYVKMMRVPGTHLAFQRSVSSVINLFGQYMQTKQRAWEIDLLPPTALFWGKKDPILPIKQGLSMLAQSTGITLTTYPKCGHFPQLDIASTFAHDLKEFLNDPDRPFGILYSETKKQGLPEIQENRINDSKIPFYNVGEPDDAPVY